MTVPPPVVPRPGPAQQTIIPMARPWFGEEEVRAVEAVVRSGWVSQGPKVAEFERAVEALTGARRAVAVSNCTTALHLGMIAAGVGRGDEVVVPSLSFVATANAARYVGATPVFADVDPASHDVTAETVEAVLTPATRAVVVVHQCGVPADLDPLRSLCRSEGLFLVEDAACAIGTSYRGRPVGGDSDLAAFSFHPRKILVTGEGGMITTQDPDLAARLSRLRQHGMSVSAFDRHSSGKVVVEQYLETGFNFRMTDMQAALGVVQAAKVPGMVARRRELALGYQERLSEVEDVQVVADPPYGLGNFQSFWVVLPDDFPVSRDGLLDLLLEEGVHARHGVTAAHLEPAFADLRNAPLPVPERVNRQSLVLPMYHDMSVDDQDRVVAVVARAARGRSRDPA